MDEQGIGEAIAEVVNADPQAVAAVVGEGAQGENSEAQNQGETAPPVAQGESQPSKDDAGTEGTEPEAGDGTGDAPTEYWGVDLTGIPAEKAREIVAHFEQQDGSIRKLQERLAKEPEKQAAPETQEPEEVTDEAILKAIGLDPESYEVQQVAPMILPALRNQLALEERLDAIEQQATASQAETYWNKALDELEATNGKLPGNRLGVLQYAIEENIASPYEAYFRLTTPIKQEVSDFVQKARREAGKAQAGGQMRPSSSSAGGTAITKETSLHDAVRIAAQEAEKETKISWKDALRSRLRTGAQGPEEA